ncbi:hypothetical protein K0M31_000151 [Melipona bicolor]|uniref:Uncharacterized protein n=1 Tax=Melipona bicolor TaxID=60889 RepID=A0AA40GE99_9HYME|nr:hypothetical protein K0M31_000151 [Melipona bicolor]
MRFSAKEQASYVHLLGCARNAENSRKNACMCTWVCPSHEKRTDTRLPRHQSSLYETQRPTFVIFSRYSNGKNQLSICRSCSQQTHHTARAFVQFGVFNALNRMEIEVARSTIFTT